MKIVLIGFMGTGKTSVAPLLAAKLGLDAIEMDDLIMAKAGRRSIPDIFKAGGESAFRELEMAVAKDLAGRDNAVISTGGGVVTSQATMGYLTKDAAVVGLAASFDTVLERINPKMPRPLFQDRAQAKALYDLRRPLYSKYAVISVATDGKTVDEVVEAITSQIDKVKNS